MKIYFIFLIMVSSGMALADIGSTYGFGSSTSALSGANRSIAYDGYALDRSPSLMSFMPTTNSYGFLYARDQFEKISNVQTDSFFTGGSARTGNVETDIPDTFSFLFGSVWALGKSERNYRLGVNFATPVDKITEPSTNDPYQPQYYGYAADSQRLTISTGLSALISPQWSFGLGVHYYLLQAATYQSHMPSDTGSGRTTTGNLKTTVKPSLAPFAGVTWTNQLHSLTAYYSGTRDHKLKVKNETVFGPANSTVAFNGEVSLFHDPETWSLGYALTTSSWDWMLSGDWERWSRYDGGYMKFSDMNFNLRQYPVNMKFKDILILKTGLSHKWNDSAFRFGVAYRPSPYSDLNEQTNYIEPDRWIGGVGYGFNSTVWGLLDDAVKFETHFQTHYLVPKEVTKTDSTSIGAPGYKVGGYVFSYGLNMVVDL